MVRRRYQIRFAMFVFWLTSSTALPANPLHLFVAPDGRDSWHGTHSQPNADRSDGPLATLEGARDELRRRRQVDGLKDGAIIWLRGGTYAMRQPLHLSHEDSGAASAKVVFAAYQNEPVVLSGGRQVTRFAAVSDPQVMRRLDSRARGHVLQCRLSASGVDDLGEVVTPGNRLELFFGGRPMTLARWPNDGFAKVVQVTEDQTFKTHGIAGSRVGRFTYDGDRPGRWKDEDDLWLHGYWFWDWSDAYQRVETINVQRREITLQPPHHHYGYRPGQRFYALNALTELDRPGEWYVDRRHHILYFWPPEPAEPISAAVSVTPHLIRLQGASHVVFRGITLELTRSTAIIIEGGTGNRIEACVIRNTGDWAVSVVGQDHAVVGCDIHAVGAGGIRLSGGDRRTLTPANLLAHNNHIHDFGRIYRTYRPAVGIGGVGNRVSNNLIHNGPHNAVQLGGNDHVIELNEIYDVCYETGDVGAFYMGRDWTQRGTVIRHNYFHDIHGPGLHGAMAVYLDDAASGISILGNLFYRAGRAAFIGGGRDNTVENNVFVQCKPAVHVDARGLGWMRYHVEKDGIMQERLRQMPYQTPPWSTRYPKLVDILQGDPGAPTGNVIRRNISVGGRWADIQSEAKPLVTLRDNLVDQDPRFVDAENLNFRLRDDSPALQMGFEPIPIDDMGLHQDGPRASWPVQKTRRLEDGS